MSFTLGVGAISSVFRDCAMQVVQAAKKLSREFKKMQDHLPVFAQSYGAMGLGMGGNHFSPSRSGPVIINNYFISSQQAEAMGV